MKQNVANEYAAVSVFLGLKGKDLMIDIARLGDIIKQSYDNELINEGSQIVPLMYAYLIGKGKFQDQYYEEVKKVELDLLTLIDDYLLFTYKLDLLKD